LFFKDCASRLDIKTTNSDADFCADLKFNFVRMLTEDTKLASDLIGL